ncbi:MAG: hypothetical protein RSG52_07885 [Terrisporobacter sp.]|uniref:hypothetical protein n=1 Tax=Terrisporobacter sp. TaxID=1965305 RepID=UPI002FC84FC1
MSRNGRNFNNPIEEKEMSSFIKSVNTSGKGYSPSFKEIYTYNIQRTLATNVFPLDKEYWDEKDWINRSYFPGAKVNFVKKIYGNSLYKILCDFIKHI